LSDRRGFGRSGRGLAGPQGTSLANRGVGKVLSSGPVNSQLLSPYKDKHPCCHGNDNGDIYHNSNPT